MKANSKILFLAAGVVLLLGGVLAFLKWQEFQGESAKLARMSAERKSRAEIERDLASKQQEREEVLQRLRFVERGVPSSAYVPTLLKELEALGNQSGLTVFGIRPTEPVEKPAGPPKEGEPRPKRKPYKELQIEINGRGNYGDLLRFMAQLDQFPKIVGVRLVAITPKSDADNPSAAPSLDVQIGVRAYVFEAGSSPIPPKEATPATPAAVAPAVAPAPVTGGKNG